MSWNSVGVNLFLLTSICAWMVSGGCIGGIWMVSLYVCGVRMCLGAHLLQGGEFILFWHSPVKGKFFSPGYTEISKYQNVHIYPKQKWLGFAIFYFFSACQREIKKHSHLDHPVP